MDNQAQKHELIVKTTLELLQNVLPTNIMTNLEQLDGGSNSDANEFVDDLDEDRFIFEQLSKKWNRFNEVSKPAKAEGRTTAAFQESPFDAGSEFNGSDVHIDNSSSLTYYEIVEQEMMQSLPVTKDNILV